jgi:hypothetical protein
VCDAAVGRCRRNSRQDGFFAGFSPSQEMGCNSPAELVINSELNATLLGLM